MSHDFPEPTEKDCLGTLCPEAVKGFHLFNNQQYWEAHEALEQAWLKEPGELRHLYRGVLQIGVAYLHVMRANYRGAIKVYHRSKRWLEPFPDQCCGINLWQLRQDAETLMTEVYRLGPQRIAEIDLHFLKPLQWRENV